MTKSKQLYEQFCQQENNIPLFLKYSWFDNLYDKGEWEVAIAKKGNDVVGILPYVIVKKKGFNLITPQFLSPYQGVWMKYPDGQKYASKLGFEKEVMSSLIEQLPKVAAFKQNFLPQITNWFPFYCEDFEQTTRYTYVINDISDQKKIFSDFKDNIRREIRKAEKLLTVSTIPDIDLMYQMKLKVYNHNNEPYVIPEDKLKKVYNYCETNDCGELLVAKDVEGNIHSVLLYVWDDVSAYYLHGVTATEFKTSGSMSLLLWEAIQRSSKKTKTFNFEGSMTPSIERYFRAFGGKQTPYFQISKTDSKVLKLLNY